jgi:chemotaxis protein MotB
MKIMKFAIKPVILGLAICATLTSCVKKSDYDALQAEKDALAQSLAESQDRIKSLEEANEALTADKDALTADLDQVKEDLKMTMSQVEEIKGLVAAKEAELSKIQGDVKAAFAGYEDAGLTIESSNDQILISMPEQVLFRSSSSSLDRSDKDIITKLAEVLKNDASLSVIVEGHTDNAKMKEGVGFDNWDLSVRRSMTVVRTLIREGVAPEQITAAGSGEFSPVVSDDASSTEAREKNRRTEFIIVPNLSELFKVYKG